MKKHLLLLIAHTLLATPLIAAPMSLEPPAPTEQKIAIQNSILTKINGKTISVLDVMKKMDVLFHRSYPQLIDSKQARFQFYQASWQHILSEMIDTELMLADAKKLELQIPDGEIREEMEKRFAPNLMKTLDKIGLSFEEAWEMLKTELIVQRMSWYNIHSKAHQTITPEDIRAAYQEYLKKNPPTKTWTYQVISIQADDESSAKEIADKTYEILSKNKTPDASIEELSALEKTIPNSSIKISTEFKTNSAEISLAHKEPLELLEQGKASKPLLQTSRNQKSLFRVFYLKEMEIIKPSDFNQMSNQLKNELVQKQSETQSKAYVSKLCDYYNIDKQAILKDITVQPFKLQ